MDIRLMFQSTPNPNALKFVLNVPVKTEGNVTYKNIGQTKENPLAEVLFTLNDHISEVYFFDNYITVTQDGQSDWDELEGKIRAAIMEKIKDHDPNFKIEEPKKTAVTAAANSPEINQINAILDFPIRAEWFPLLPSEANAITITDLGNVTYLFTWEDRSL